MAEQTEPGPRERYVHFRESDRVYEVIGIEFTGGDPRIKEIIYKQLYSTIEHPAGTIHRRSLEEFCGDKVLPDGTKVKRFRRVK